jgi:hypothetical protein
MRIKSIKSGPLMFLILCASAFGEGCCPEPKGANMSTDSDEERDQTGAADQADIANQTGASDQAGAAGKTDAADQATGTNQAGITDQPGAGDESGKTEDAGTAEQAIAENQAGETEQDPASNVPVQPSHLWKTAHTLCLGLLLVVTAAWVLWSQWGTGFGTGHDADWQKISDKYLPLAGWLAAIVIMIGFGCVIGDGVAGRKDGLFLDRRNKISLTRLQVSMWTCLILGAFVAATLWNIARGGPEKINIPPPIWALFAVSIASGASATFIKINMDDKAATNAENTEADWTELVKGDATTNACKIDQGKVQMLAFTAIVVITYSVMLAGQFISSADFKSFPDLDASIVALLTTSHAGYLTSKYLGPGK